MATSAPDERLRMLIDDRIIKSSFKMPLRRAPQDTYGGSFFFGEGSVFVDEGSDPDERRRMLIDDRIIKSSFKMLLRRAPQDT